MNQSWGHAYSILIFSRQAKVSWLARFLPMAQILALIVAQIVPALNNNDNCNVFLAYSYSSECF